MKMIGIYFHNIQKNGCFHVFPPTFPEVPAKLSEEDDDDDNNNEANFVSLIFFTIIQIESYPAVPVSV